MKFLVLLMNGPGSRIYIKITFVVFKGKVDMSCIWMMSYENLWLKYPMDMIFLYEHIHGKVTNF